MYESRKHHLSNEALAKQLDTFADMKEAKGSASVAAGLREAAHRLRGMERAVAVCYECRHQQGIIPERRIEREVCNNCGGRDIAVVGSALVGAGR